MKIKPHLKQIRRVSQFLVLAIFLFLFRETDYSGSDTLPYAVNIFFRLDPLVLATLTLAKKTVLFVLWPSLIVLALTLLFGRVFCSWFCPLGTLIDISGRFISTKKTAAVRLKHVKYGILVVLLVSSAFGVQFSGFFDPFAILVRGMAFSLDPLLNYVFALFFDGIYAHGPEMVSTITEPFYQVLKDVVLPYRQSFFYLSFLSFFMLLAIFMLELFGRRFWCRTLCPLGALLALVSKLSLFKRIPARACSHCRMCDSGCRMQAFDTDGRMAFEECSLCMDCLEFCPEKITTFRFALPRTMPGMDLSRRQWLAAGFLGGVLPVLTRTHALSKMPEDSVIRPPGALDEVDFLAACVRCGECMKVCINNALQPLLLEKGVEGMFTPKLVPRLGYCEFNCTLCTQVCPTRALEQLTQAQKHGFVMGKAWFDQNRCLVYARKKNCMVCEEHCPTHDKAIRFQETAVTDWQGKPLVLKVPYVVETLCIGCGICEHICPVEGTSAIRVTGKDSRPRSGTGYGFT